METTQTSQSLYQVLWNSADVLRSKMDANDYKSYLLGMVFYKYLSDKMLFFVAETMEEGSESLEAALEVYRNYYEDGDTHEDLLAVMKDELNYSIKPDLTFTALVVRVNEGTFQLEDLAQGFRGIELLPKVDNCLRFVRVFLGIEQERARPHSRIIDGKS